MIWEITIFLTFKGQETELKRIMYVGSNLFTHIFLSCPENLYFFLYNRAKPKYYNIQTSSHEFTAYGYLKQSKNDFTLLMKGAILKYTRQRSHK